MTIPKSKVLSKIDTYQKLIIIFKAQNDLVALDRAKQGLINWNEKLKLCK